MVLTSLIQTVRVMAKDEPNGNYRLVTCEGHLSDPSTCLFEWCIKATTMSTNHPQCDYLTECLNFNVM